MQNLKLKVLVADDSRLVHDVFNQISGHSPIPFDVVSADDGQQCWDTLSRGGIHVAFIDVNIEVTEAGDGQMALDYCVNGEFDVVFLDCNMPGLPGTATLERLLERDPGVKVIMITGERNEARRRWALERGAAAFLYKPFNATDVDRELHALFGLRTPQLAGIEPMKFGREVPTPSAPVEVQW